MDDRTTTTGDAVGERDPEPGHAFDREQGFEENAVDDIADGTGGDSADSGATDRELPIDDARMTEAGAADPDAGDPTGDGR